MIHNVIAEVQHKKKKTKLKEKKKQQKLQSDDLDFLQKPVISSSDSELSETAEDVR